MREGNNMEVQLQRIPENEGRRFKFQEHTPEPRRHTPHLPTRAERTTQRDQTTLSVLQQRDNYFSEMKRVL